MKIINLFKLKRNRVDKINYVDLRHYTLQGKNRYHLINKLKIDEINGKRFKPELTYVIENKIEFDWLYYSVKNMLLHPVTINVNLNTEEIIIANISTNCRQMRYIDIECIGPNIKGKDIYLYGPVKIKLNSLNSWIWLKKEVLKMRKFNFEKELKKEAYEKLLVKCKIEEWDNVGEIIKIDTILMSKGMSLEDVISIEWNEKSE